MRKYPCVEAAIGENPLDLCCRELHLIIGVLRVRTHANAAQYTDQRVTTLRFVGDDYTTGTQTLFHLLKRRRDILYMMQNANQQNDVESIGTIQILDIAANEFGS